MKFAPCHVCHETKLTFDHERIEVECLLCGNTMAESIPGTGWHHLCVDWNAMWVHEQMLSGNWDYKHSYDSGADYDVQRVQLHYVAMRCKGRSAR